MEINYKSIGLEADSLNILMRWDEPFIWDISSYFKFEKGGKCSKPSSEAQIIWYLLLTDTPVFASNSFENMT